MTIDVIIPNYNGSALVEKNLPYVLKATSGLNSKIIIVDDGSDPSDTRKLRNFVSSMGEYKILLIEHDKNKGFSSAINTGVNNSKAEFVVFLNSDVRPNADFLVSPIKILQSDEDLFGVGSMDESVEGERTVLRGRGLASWSRGMLIHRRGPVDRQNTFWISGGSSIVRRRLFEKLGGMDELFNPFYWEDIDLSFRAQKAGYKLLFDNNSIVMHVHSEGSIKSHFAENKVNRIAYRNQFVFIWKNITDVSLLLSHVAYLPLHLTKALLRKDSGMLSGFFLALKLLPAIIKKRGKQRKYSVLSDRFILARSK